MEAKIHKTVWTLRPESVLFSNLLRTEVILWWLFAATCKNLPMLHSANFIFKTVNTYDPKRQLCRCHEAERKTEPVNQSCWAPPSKLPKVRVRWASRAACESGSVWQRLASCVRGLLCAFGCWIIAGLNARTRNFAWVKMKSCALSRCHFDTSINPYSIA